MTKNSKAIIGIHAIMSIMGIYLYTFQVARFYQAFEPTSAIKAVALYYFVVYAIAMISFVVEAPFIKKHCILLFKFGILMNVVTLILMMLFETTSWYVLVAIIFGISQGCYYAPFTNLVTLSTYGKDENVKKFWTVSNICNKVVSIVFPITIGSILEVTTFNVMSGFFVFLGLCQFLLCISIKLPLNTVSNSELHLVKFWKEIKKFPKLTSYYCMVACEGATGSILDKLITFLVLLIYQTTFSLGAWSSVFTIFQIIVIFAIKKFYKAERIKKWIILSIIPTSLMVIILSIYTNSITFIVYQAVSCISLAILSQLNNFSRYSILENNILKSYEVEHQATVEITLGISRLLGFGAIIIVISCFSISALLTIKICIIAMVLVVILYAKNAITVLQR